MTSSLLTFFRNDALTGMVRISYGTKTSKPFRTRLELRHFLHSLYTVASLSKKEYVKLLAEIDTFTWLPEVRDVHHALTFAYSMLALGNTEAFIALGSPDVFLYESEFESEVPHLEMCPSCGMHATIFVKKYKTIGIRNRQMAYSYIFYLLDQKLITEEEKNALMLQADELFLENTFSEN